MNSLAVFYHENAITKVAYVSWKYRSVLLLSSGHYSVSVDSCDEKLKSLMIMEYNKAKGRVDTFYQNIDEYSCRRKTTRWPLLLYYNILDVSAFNAFLLMRANGYTKSRSEFIRNLTLQLATPFVSRRVLAQRTTTDAKARAALIGIYSPPTVIQLAETTSSNPGRCRMCGKNTRSRCDACGKSCCPSHRIPGGKF
jgi:hypothetical protein